MGSSAAPLIAPDLERDTSTRSRADLDPGWLVICWNDPVNFMDYVTHVFQTVFGWTRQKAEFHMLQVHRQGKSVLARETMEKAEHYLAQGWQFALPRSAFEWVMQVLNDVRVGSWIALGSPEELPRDLPGKAAVARHVCAMELAGLFQMELLKAVEAPSAGAS